MHAPELRFDRCQKRSLARQKCLACGLLKGIPADSQQPAVRKNTLMKIEDMLMVSTPFELIQYVRDGKLKSGDSIITGSNGLNAKLKGRQILCQLQFDLTPLEVKGLYYAERISKEDFDNTRPFFKRQVM